MSNLIKQVISIHGAPRSGTSWLGQIFDSSSETKYCFQPYFSYEFKNRVDLYSSEEEIETFFSDLLASDNDFINQKENKAKNYYTEFKKSAEPSTLVTKEVRYHYLLPHLMKLIPYFMAVAIIRHPCGALNSWRKAPKEFNPAWSFHEEWEFAPSKNNFRPEEYYGFHRWMESTQLFMMMENLFPARFKIITYEELAMKPFESTEALFSYFNLKMSDQTTDFLHDSTTIRRNDAYSVFQGKKDVFDWQADMDKAIIRKIERSLTRTSFERFLR